MEEMCTHILNVFRLIFCRSCGLKGKIKVFTENLGGGVLKEKGGGSIYVF